MTTMTLVINPCLSFQRTIHRHLHVWNPSGRPEASSTVVTQAKPVKENYLMAATVKTVKEKQLMAAKQLTAARMMMASGTMLLKVTRRKLNSTCLRHQQVLTVLWAAPGGRSRPS